MQQMTRLCVYCGSKPGDDPRYRAAAAELGEGLAKAGIELIFGGGHIGLMGVVADAALAGGGRVVGIIPDRLRSRELAHPGATELVVTATMHDRKREMAERADAFAVLPGGIGTLDEMFEILTWRSLGLHDKPIFIVDIAGYWQPLRGLLDHLAAHAFTQPLIPDLLKIVPSVAALLDMLARRPPGGPTRAELL